MKRTVICLALVLSFIGIANAQTKSMSGTVIDYTVGNRGTWAGITIKVGNEQYFVYTESTESPTPTMVGKINEIGRTVQVFYTRVVNSPGFDGELRATKIVEIKPSSVQQPRADLRVITGKVLQIIDSNAGKQVQIESNGKTYQFGLGTINNRDPGIQITRAWETTLNKLKRGDEVTIEYNELQGYYGAALRVRLNQPRNRTGNNQAVLSRGRSESQLSSRTANDTSLISDLRNSNLVEGCGCNLKRSSAGRNAHSYVFFMADTGSSENNRAYMNIDGRDTALRFVSSTQRPRRLRRGSQYTEVYRSGDVTAGVTYVVTKPSTSGGEVTKYSATITVTRGNRSQTVRASGECGC